MRLLIQRASRARVEVDGETTGEIAQGLVVFVAAGTGDEDDDLAYCVDKTANLRIFADDDGQMNLSVRDVDGSILAVPQFTLYADVSEGRRPSFFEAMDPGPAEQMYEEYVDALRDEYDLEVETGEFGASMDVDLVNDGPVTIWVDSNQ
jgi:D-tyrosyl-tRNA(Tyr) deacylase